MGIQGYGDTRIRGYNDTGIRGYRDIRGYKDTGIQAYKDTEDTGVGTMIWIMQGYRNTGMQETSMGSG